MTYQTNVLTNMLLVGSAWRIWTAGVSKLHYLSIIPPKLTERACCTACTAVIDSMELQ